MDRITMHNTGAQVNAPAIISTYLNNWRLYNSAVILHLYVVPKKLIDKENSYIIYIFRFIAAPNELVFQNE
jgi:hypothetical protein